MATDRATFAFLTVMLAAPVAAQEPLSAIDWLSQSVATPAVLPSVVEPPATTSVLPEEVAVTVLGGPSVDAVGLLSPQVTGLPAALWGLGRSTEIASMIGKERVESLPALRDLLLTLLLAEATPPSDSGTGGVLLIARIDKLLDMGALDQANALLNVAGKDEPDLFRRSFDVGLLTGAEDRGCRAMVDAPGLAPTFPARIFCLARSGDWNAAALTLRTAQVLGYVTAEEDALLSRFLDPDLFEGEPPLPVPARVTPLTWRMFEAIGEPLPTSTLPLAFAHAELRPTAGWKAQIDAAERLARAGAIPANVLLGLYTERKPAASGGVWDRVAAFQKLEDALNTGDPATIAAVLPETWARMAEAELEVPFAELYGESLRSLSLTGEADRIAFLIGLLSEDYESTALSRQPLDAREGFLIGLARGDLTGTTPPDSLARAIVPAFGTQQPAQEFTDLLDQNRLGEALLLAVEQIESGLQGDLAGVTKGLVLLRHVGLETTARRTALELMLLERRG